MAFGTSALPLLEIAARDARRPQEAAFAPEDCTFASASGMMSSVEST